jgi:hypothetical protein
MNGLRVLTVGPWDALRSDMDTRTTTSVNTRVTVFSYFTLPR